MKLLMISFAWAGAGGLAVGANNVKIVDEVAPEIFNKLGETNKGDIETFIITPHPQCIVSTETLDMNSIVGECLSHQRKWIKAI